MARPIVSDELWEVIEPLIPKVERRFRHPGRKRIDDRKVLTGILFVLQTGIPWEHLPQEMGCGSGMTCWRRLKEWQDAGVWQRLLVGLPGQARRVELIGEAGRSDGVVHAVRRGGIRRVILDAKVAAANRGYVVGLAGVGDAIVRGREAIGLRQPVDHWRVGIADDLAVAMILHHDDEDVLVPRYSGGWPRGLPIRRHSQRQSHQRAHGQRCSYLGEPMETPHTLLSCSISNEGRPRRPTCLSGGQAPHAPHVTKALLSLC